MTQTVQALLLDARRYQDSIISIAEIHRPGVIAMLIRHQGRVLSEVGFFPQVLDHCGGGVIQRNSSLAGGRFQLSHFHVPAWFSLQSIPAPDLFHTTLQVEDSVL